MRILHTSDWHLGKKLEGYSRLEEQEKFLKELVQIVRENAVDMLLIAGDIYDTSSPPAEAEKLFYDTVKELSDGGKRPIVVIAGNHDSAERLCAVASLGYEQGIIILGKPKSKAKEGKYKFYDIVKAEEGCFEIALNNERAVIITMPYPSEKRLGELISEEFKSEEEESISYSEKLGEIFEKLQDNYRKDTINLLIGHFFMLGGKETDSERPIQLGGSLAVSPSALPDKAQYIALGHLHRPQKVTDTAYYAGSPIQYSKSEINYAKSVYLADLEPEKPVQISRILLKNYKPIEVWECESIQKAIEKCEQNKDGNSWVYLYIHSDRTILGEELKMLKTLRKDIISIQLITPEQEGEFEEFKPEDKSMREIFREYYFKEKNTQPSEELMELFTEISEGEADEAGIIED